jgi:diguanylate cyclase (GGDEF)-like protein
VLLRETDAQGAENLANRIRESIGATVVTQGLAQIDLTISAGAAIVSEQDRDIEDVIERADKALYAAKSSGRNRVVLGEAGTRAGSSYRLNDLVSRARQRSRCRP